MNNKLDGRPMSGDIGRGATRESIAFALRLAAIKERPRGLYRQFAMLSENIIVVFQPWYTNYVFSLNPLAINMAGFLQLAGGTNAHTVDGMRKVGLFQTASFTSNIVPLIRF